MIIIIESGSTKSDVLVLNVAYEAILETQMIGLNPYLVNEEMVANVFQTKKELNRYKERITELYFYGAGCSLPDKQEIIKRGLQECFKNAKILVDHDLKASVYALSQNEPLLVGILGTGSNCCYFNGDEIIDITPSLGYVIGDEGSGNHIGKLLLQNYYAHKMPLHLKSDFEENFDLDITNVVDSLYKKALPNKYLATFATFAGEHKTDRFIRELVSKIFISYFEYQVEPYKNLGCMNISFVGSIAYYFKDLLEEVSNQFGFNLLKVESKPLYALVDYHKKKNHVS